MSTMTSVFPTLKGTLEFFYRAMFGDNTEVRFRPHFFPFTEPSFEIDVKLQVKGEAPKWIEVAGCGMVDPAVFEAINESRGDTAFDPAELTGYAFGMGLDRLAMIQYGIKGHPAPSSRTTPASSASSLNQGGHFLGGYDPRCPSIDDDCSLVSPLSTPLLSPILLL